MYSDTCREKLTTYLPHTGLLKSHKMQPGRVGRHGLLPIFPVCVCTSQHSCSGSHLDDLDGLAVGQNIPQPIARKDGELVLEWL